MDTKERVKQLFIRHTTPNHFYFPTCLARRDDVLYSATTMEEIMQACDELVSEGFLRSGVAPITTDQKYMQYYHENNGKQYTQVPDNQRVDLVPY